MTGKAEELSPNDKIILSFYETAKDEIFVRIKLRDTLLAVYTTSVAATFAFSKVSSSIADFPSPDTKIVLLILPYLCFAFTLLVSYHHLSIATIGAYIKYELRAKIKTSTTVHVFEGWDKFANHRTGAQRLRTMGQAIILLTPPAVALLLNSDAAISSQWNRVIYFWLGLASTILSFFVIYKSYSEQKNLNLGGRSESPVHERRSGV